MANSRVYSALGDKFSFTLANTTGATKTIALLPANFDTLGITLTEGAPNTAVLHYKSAAAINTAGITCDYALDDGTLVTNLTATADASDLTIREFLREIRSRGRKCVNITVQANNADVFNKQLKIMKRTSMQGSAWQYLSFNVFKSVDQTATDKIVLPNVNIEFAHDVLMLFSIDTARTVTFIFEFEPIA